MYGRLFFFFFTTNAVKDSGIQQALNSTIKQQNTAIIGIWEHEKQQTEQNV